MTTKYLCCFPIIIFLTTTSCGGGGGSGGGSSPELTTPPLTPSSPIVTTAEGQFIDSPVSGLSYSSGNQEGITGAHGEFTYEIVDGVSQSISFAVGSLPLGSSIGSEIITPYEITSNGTHESNVATLLLALDVDLNPTNGIEISETLVNNYSSFDWSSVDLSISDALTSDEINLFISDVSSLTQSAPVFQPPTVVEDHITKTHQCISSGNYYGEYSGDENGPVVIGADPHTSSLFGVGWSRNRNEGLGFPTGQQLLSRLTQYEFSILSTDNLNFTGALVNYSTMTGSWSSEQQGSGSFSLSKINQNETGGHQFTGTYLADIPGTGNIPTGAFSFSVKDDNSVAGEMVNIVIGTTEISTLSGNIDGSLLTINSTNGTNFEGVIDLEANTYVGNWSSETGAIQSGTFIANGCELDLN